MVSSRLALWWSELGDLQRLTLRIYGHNWTQCVRPNNSALAIGIARTLPRPCSEGWFLLCEVLFRNNRTKHKSHMFSCWYIMDPFLNCIYTVGNSCRHAPSIDCHWIFSSGGKARSGCSSQGSLHPSLLCRVHEWSYFSRVLAVTFCQLRVCIAFGWWLSTCKVAGDSKAAEFSTSLSSQGNQLWRHLIWTIWREWKCCWSSKIRPCLLTFASPLSF